MKKQWLEIDGIMTPIILPQIWNHELQDWVVTSEQNPLPTQLTGSIDELSSTKSNIVLTAGSSIDLLEDTYCTKYKEVRYAYRLSTVANSKIEIRFFNGIGRRQAGIYSKVGTSSAEHGTLSNIDSPYYRVRLINDDGEDFTLWESIITGVI